MPEEKKPAPDPETIPELKALKEKLSNYDDQGDQAHYDMGALLVQAGRDGLAKKYGFTDDVHLGAALLPRARTSLALYYRVASHFNAVQEKQLGMYKLDATLTFVKAAGIDPLPADLGSLPIPVQDAKGNVTQKPLSVATVGEIHLAAHHAAPPPPLSTSSAALLKRLQGVVEDVLGKHGHGRVSAEPVADAADFTFVRIPERLLLEFFQAAAGALVASGDASRK